jgi:glycosyltransferase involved in cell wall biosynthesis
MRIGFVNHTALVSGAEISLLELLRGLGDAVDAFVCCPEGPLADAVRALGRETVAVPAAEASLRPHLRHTPAGVWALARAGTLVRRAALSRRADLVHANSLRAGLMAVQAARSGLPLVVTVRDCLPPGTLARATVAVVGRAATRLVANSAYTRSRLPGPPAGVEVVHPPVDCARLDPRAIPREPARRALGLAGTAPVLTVVGQITPWKGQDLAIGALGRMSGRPDAQLLVAGSAKFSRAGMRFDNAAFERRLHDLARALGVAGRVHFLGERDDVGAVLAASDLVLVPSTEEPFGRVVVEAMAMATPVLATATGGPAEIVRDGVDGRLVASREPAAWAQAAAALLQDPDRLRAMGAEGRREALGRFDVPAHVQAMRAIYAEAQAVRRTR